MRENFAVLFVLFEKILGSYQLRQAIAMIISSETCAEYRDLVLIRSREQLDRDQVKLKKQEIRIRDENRKGKKRGIRTNHLEVMKSKPGRKKKPRFFSLLLSSRLDDLLHMLQLISRLFLPPAEESSPSRRKPSLHFQILKDPA